MTRDEEFKELAERLRAAEVAFLAAEAEHRAANTKMQVAQVDRNALQKKLKEFVGANQPVRNAVVCGTLVRVQHFSQDDVRVSVETLV